MASGGRARYLSGMLARRALFAATLLPAAAPAARAFRLEPADAGTEALIAARAEACTVDGLHTRLQADLAAALETAAREGRSAEEVLVAALTRCPLCGCGLAPIADASADAPGF